MKIGFIVQDVSLGGGERILSMLMDSFHKRRNEIIIYTWNNRWHDVSLGDGYTIVNLEHYPNFGSKFKAFKSFNRAVKNNRPDCIITFVSGLAEVAIWAAKINRVPFIMSERCDPIYYPDKWYRRISERIVYALCDGLVFQTKKVQSFFPKIIRKHSIVIPNPLIDDNHPIANVNTFNKEIIGIGRLSDQKNFAVLIDAFAQSQLPGYVLRIYGEGPERNMLEQKICNYKMQDRIFLMGKVDKVIEHIVNSDIFVLSSIHEGMPNVLLESMAMGLACIAFDVPSHGARELIKNEENGFLVPVNDKDTLIKKMEYLANHPTEKEKMKRNALRIRETNSKDAIIPLWINYIQTIIYNKKK